jgi:uncharacterized protein (TIGR00730 family)
MKAICVFSGSNSGKNPGFLKVANQLGKTLAEKNIALIYGGASVGLMGAVADGALTNGGQVFGVIPKHLESKEISHKTLTKLYLVESMHQRKQLMFDLADAFITIPGGLGSLEELCEILTWAQLGLHQKPCGLLNFEGFYDSLIAQFDHILNEDLMKKAHREMIIVDKSVDGLLKKFLSYQPPVTEKWLKKKET